MNQISGIEAVERIRDDLEASGLPRNSRLSGGEITGWTTYLGHTGFSIRKNESDITWHLVVSGKPHLEYREYTHHQDDEEIDLHEPINPERLNQRIAKVFKRLNLSIHDVRCTGHSTLWDDDVHYEVTTDLPDWLSTKN